MASKVFKDEWVYSPAIHTLTCFDKDGHEYEIDLDRINSWSSALSWIGHVFQKAWTTEKTMWGLLEAFDHFYEMDGAEHRKFTSNYGKKWLVFPKPVEETTKSEGSKIEVFSMADIEKKIKESDANWERSSYVRCVRAGLTG